MDRKVTYSVAGACILALLVASPFRNLHNLSVCLGDRRVLWTFPRPRCDWKSNP